MKIAVFTGRYPAVSEQFIQRDLKAIEADGHEVFIWPCEEKLQQSRWTNPLGKPFPPVLNRIKFSSRNIFSFLRCCGLLQLRRIPAVMRALQFIPSRPDLILTEFLSLPAVIGIAAAKALGVPSVASLHASGVWCQWPPASHAVSQADRILCCNKAAQVRAEEVLNKDVLLLHHSFNMNHIGKVVDPATSANDVFTILAAGRMVEKKGFEILLKAFALVAEKHPGIRLQIVGNGPLRIPLEIMADSCGLTREAVFFKDMLPQIEFIPLLTEASMLVVPSVVAKNGDRDGIPNVILEAMACGVPVIASDAGSIKEVVKNNETGRLVPQSNVPALADAILEVVNSKSDRQITENAKHLVQEMFCQEKTIKKRIELFSEVVGLSDLRAS